MTSDDRNDDIAEIDFSEIVAAARPSLPVAAVVGILCGIGGTVYGKNLEKQYVADAQFTIGTKRGSQISDLGGAFSGLLPRQGSASEAVLAADKIMSRDFIRDLYKTTDIENDPFFIGPFAPSGSGKDTETGLVYTLRNILLGPPSFPTDAKRHEQIVRAFRQAVRVNLKDNGIINVTVRHSDPVAAADLANGIVEAHISNVERKRITDDLRQVELTEARLSKAKEALDRAQAEVRLFVTENSARSKEELGANSLNLTRFRKELERISAVLDGIAYLERERQISTSDTVDLDAFSAAHPIAFAPLLRDLGWNTDQGNLPLPARLRLDNLKRSMIEERDRVTRTLRVIETEAAQTADAAGRLAKLEREAEVRLAIYTGLVSQFEARALGAELQATGQVESIQEAVAPVFASSPRVHVIAMISAVLGALAVIAMALLRSRRIGRLYTTNQVAQSFNLVPRADNIGNSVGSRLKTLNVLLRESRQFNHVELVDLALTLRDEKLRRLMVLGVPRTPVVHNLAVIMGIGMTDSAERVAIIELARTRTGTSEMPMHSHGTLTEVENSSRATVFRWTERSARDGKTLPFDEALSQVEEAFDRMVIAAAPLGRGTVQNKLALNQVDRVVLVASRGKTVKREIDLVNKLLSYRSEVKADLVLT